MSSPTRGAAQSDRDVPQPYLDRLVRMHLGTDKSARIVDLGCGSGLLLRTLARHGFANAIGVDVSTEQVAAAWSNGVPNVRQADLLETLCSIETGTVDFVVTFDVLEHFNKSEVLALVDEVRRVLRPGGRWLLHVPNAESPFGMRVRYGDFSHELAFTAGALRQVLGAAGFSKVEVHEDQPIAHGPISAVRWMLWQAIRTGLRLAVAVETGSFERGVFSQNLLAVAHRGAGHVEAR